MPPTGFEPAIPASERSQTHAFDRDRLMCNLLEVNSVKYVYCREYTQYYVSLTEFEFLHALTMVITMFRSQTTFLNFFQCHRKCHWEKPVEKTFYLLTF